MTIEIKFAFLRGWHWRQRGKSSKNAVFFFRAEKSMTATDVTGFDVIFSTGFFAAFSRFLGARLTKLHINTGEKAKNPVESLQWRQRPENATTIKFWKCKFYCRAMLLSLRRLLGTLGTFCRFFPGKNSKTQSSLNFLGVKFETANSLLRNTLPPGHPHPKNLFRQNIAKSFAKKLGDLFVPNGNHR